MVLLYILLIFANGRLCGRFGFGCWVDGLLLANAVLHLCKRASKKGKAKISLFFLKFA